MARLLCFLALVLNASPAFAVTYANARFGYTIAYRGDLLIAEPEADNGDGRSFHARHGAAKLLVWGSNRDADESPTVIARQYQGDCAAGKIAYSVVKPKLVAFSCVTAKGDILYQKTIIGDDRLCSLRFDYPAAERATWDGVVKEVSASLRTGSP
jgi:hypothetical protein